MYRSKKTMLALSIGLAFTVSACGGSSGGSSDVLDDQGGMVADDVVDNGADDDADDVVDSGADDDANDVVDSGANDDVNDVVNNEADDDADDVVNNGADDDGAQEPADITSVTSGGRTARALVAVGGPVQGVPGASMVTVSSAQLNNTGQVAYTGSFASGNDRPSAIWSGSVDSPALVYRTGDEVVGFPSNVRYGATELFRLASDGSLLHLVQLTGPTENQALLITNGLENSTVVETGDSLMGRSAAIEVNNIESISHSINATAFSTGTSRFNAQTLWYHQDGTSLAVAEQFDRTVESAAEVSNTCRVFTDRFSNYTGTFVVTDSGDLVFDAYLSNYSTGPCVAGDAVVRYNDGAYTDIVKEGDVVPGAPASIFTAIDLLAVTKSGTALVSANVETPTGGSRPDVKWSYWAFASDGTARLIALEGEEVQVGTTSKTLSHTSFRTRFITLNDNAQAGLRLDFGNDNEVTLLGGSAHLSQPHPALAAPGAASLTYAIDREATLPAPFESSEFFSTIGNPRIDSAGNLVFYGEVTSSVLDSVTSESVWQIDLLGNLTEVIKSGDTVSISGIDNALDMLAQSSSFDLSNSGNIQIDDAGAMMFLASTSSRRNSVIVYIDPPADQ